jgi:hypothetical protein
MPGEHGVDQMSQNTSLEKRCGGSRRSGVIEIGLPNTLGAFLPGKL